MAFLLNLVCHAVVQSARVLPSGRAGWLHAAAGSRQAVQRSGLAGMAAPTLPSGRTGWLHAAAGSRVVVQRSGLAGMAAPKDPTTAQWEWRPVISWYPGHIARAEKQLLDMLKLVDVVIELRDSRIPVSTKHPLMDQWVGNRHHILVMNRCDSVPTSVAQDWTRHLAASGTVAYWVNAKEGQGIDPLRRAIMLTGKGMNEKRVAKGLLPRPVRACILGFPNVGKSALINRLVGRARMKSENRAGVTRQFTWGQVGGQKSKGRASAGGNQPDLLLLDTPGIIPAKQVGQRSAYMLAVCDDIGAAAYDTRAVALTLIEELRTAKTGYVLTIS